MTGAFVELYPWPYHPVLDVDAGLVDDSVTVEVFQLRAGDASRLIGWVGGTGEALADGGAIVCSETEILGRLALGDFAVRLADGSYEFHPAAGFYSLYRPAAAAE